MSRLPAPTPPGTQQQQAAAVSFVAKRKKATGEKRKWYVLDFDLENPHPVDPSSFMGASREAARLEQANRPRREIEVAIPLDRTSQEGGYNSDPTLVAAIKQLPSHLQLVVTLMANMVTLDKEEKLLEKWGWGALSQVTNMMLAVSIIFLRKFF